MNVSYQFHTLPTRAQRQQFKVRLRPLCAGWERTLNPSGWSTTIESWVLFLIFGHRLTCRKVTTFFLIEDWGIEHKQWGYELCLWVAVAAALFWSINTAEAHFPFFFYQQEVRSHINYVHFLFLSLAASCQEEVCLCNSISTNVCLCSSQIYNCPFCTKAKWKYVEV